MKKLLLLLITFVAANSYAQATLVLDINKGNNSSSPGDKIVFNNQAYFAANNGADGVELWKSDGTETGTEMVKDINPGSGNSFSTNTPIKVYNNELFFTYGTKLWKSDVTTAGTVELLELESNPKAIVIFNSKIHVFTYSNAFWVSDGTIAGSEKIETTTSEFFHNNEYTVVGNQLFFQANNEAGYEIWKTDGTAIGSGLVKDIHPEFDDNNIEGIIDLNGKAIFTASDGNWLGKELYILMEPKLALNF